MIPDAGHLAFCEPEKHLENPYQHLKKNWNSPENGFDHQLTVKMEWWNVADERIRKEKRSEFSMPLGGPELEIRGIGLSDTDSGSTPQSRSSSE
jgi:hypothetical protein